jgi:butyryl-CoA dehydrogenase
VEQYWRDNRLNMIHEGTHGIQAMDLLGRKVLMEGGKALQEVGATTKAAWATDDPQQALANAVPYMQAFGHTVLAWTWLDVSLAVLDKDPALAAPANAGRMAAMRYFFRYELPRIGAWLKVVRECDMTCAEMSEEAF